MIDPPRSEDSIVLSDWAEACCLFSRPSISHSQLESALELAEIPEADILTDDVLMEVERRGTYFKNRHPVRLVDGRLERAFRWTDVPGYSFQLLLALESQYPTTKISRSRWNTTSKLFERLTGEALRSYTNQAPLIVGARRKLPVPKAFRECVKHVLTSLNEEVGRMDPLNVNAQDEKIDLIAWSPVGDGRMGQVIALVQCAAGKGWNNKKGELLLGLNLWKDLINWRSTPVTVLAFPFICNDDDWKYHSIGVGILFDRLRINALGSSLLDPVLRNELITWCEHQLALMPLDS